MGSIFPIPNGKGRYIDRRKNYVVSCMPDRARIDSTLPLLRLHLQWNPSHPPNRKDEQALKEPKAAADARGHNLVFYHSFSLNLADLWHINPSSFAFRSPINEHRLGGMNGAGPLQRLYVLKGRNRIQNTIRGKKKGKKKKKETEPSADRPSSSESNSNQERVLWVGRTRGVREVRENVGECAAAALDDVVMGDVKSSLRVKELSKSRGGTKCSRRMVLLK